MDQVMDSVAAMEYWIIALTISGVIVNGQIPTSRDIVDCFPGLGCSSSNFTGATVADCCDNKILPPVGCSYRRASDGQCVDCPIVFGFVPATFVGSERTQAYSVDVGYLSGYRPHNAISFGIQLRLGSASSTDIQLLTSNGRVRQDSIEFVAVSFVLVADEVAQENDETFTLSMTVVNILELGPSYALVDTFSGTILDSDRVDFSFSRDEYTATEGSLPSNNPIFLPALITKNKRLANPVTLRVSPLTVDEALTRGSILSSFPNPNRADSADFDGSTRTIVFNADEGQGLIREKLAQVAVFDDEILEASEQFILLLEVIAATNINSVCILPRNVTISTIENDDQVVVEFSIVAYSVEEGEVANLSVVLVGISDIEVQVSLNTQDVSAHAPGDYLPVVNQVVTFASGSTNTIVQIQPLLDSTPEPTEQFICVLSSLSPDVTIGNGTTTINVLESEFCLSNATVFEGVTNLSWPVTAVGMVTSVPCPSSNATRECSADGVWMDPNTENCTLDLSNIVQLLSADYLEVQVDIFSEKLRDTEADAEQQTLELLSIVAAFFDGVAALVDNIVQNGGTIPPGILSGLISSLDSLQQWNPSVIARTSDSSMIVMDFEFVAEEFSGQVTTSTDITEPGIIFTAENANLIDVALNGRSVIFFNNSIMTENTENSVFPDNALALVSLPSSLFSNANFDDAEGVGIFFASYKESTLFPVRDSEQTNGTYFSPRRAIATVVVAATVASGEFSDLQSPVEIFFKTNTWMDTIRSGSETCVSWDFEAANGHGNWTSEGCATVNITDDVVMCQCNHLTNFAILVDICSRIEDCPNPPETYEDVISYISIVGVSLSLFGLAITVITLVAFPKLRNRDISTYHIQLSITIFFMLLVFIVGVDETRVYEGCVTVSALIHYFSLAAVLWMGAEAVLMFQKLVLVFKKVTTREIAVTSIVCWVLPVVPVSIPLVLDLTTHPSAEKDLVVHRSQFCFLSNTVVFFASFLGPILLIMLFNAIICVVVTVVLLRHIRDKHSREKRPFKISTALRFMFSIAGVMSLFGLSWVFGALTVRVQILRLTFQVLFAVFTSLQGFFIFLFSCIFSKEARELWKEVLSCGHYKSPFLNPKMKFSVKKYRTPKNNNNTLPVKNTQETGVSLRPGKSTETLTCQSLDNGLNNFGKGLPAKLTDISVDSILDSDGGEEEVVLTNIDSYVDEAINESTENAVRNFYISVSEKPVREMSYKIHQLCKLFDS